jgi:hypothetical protein
LLTWHGQCLESIVVIKPMKVAMKAARQATNIEDLNSLFNSLQKPYGKGEIVRFNLTYQRLYPKLDRAERHHAERLVDALLVDLENEDLAKQVYGVV